MRGLNHDEAAEAWGRLTLLRLQQPNRCSELGHRSWRGDGHRSDEPRVHEHCERGGDEGKAGMQQPMFLSEV